MSERVAVTEADIDALKRLPEGWFEWFECGYMVRCPEFRLGRLEKRGLVEVKYEGRWPDYEKRYRVIRKAADAAIAAWNAKQDAKWAQNAEGKWERRRRRSSRARLATS